MNVPAQPLQSGEEFRDDLRPLGAPAGPPAKARMQAGQGNAAARRVLSADELAPLTRLNDARSLAAVAQTLAITAGAIAFGLSLWPSPWVLLAVLVVGVQQHAFFILAHEAAHYRLLGHRGLNDALGRAIGMAGGISMCTYRVIHRLHHNHLYGEQDPDTAIHGGYPRSVAYLWKKLAQDLAGWNAWKTFAYFFGAPAIRDEAGEGGGAAAATQTSKGGTAVATSRTGHLLNDTSFEHGGVTDPGSPLTAARTNLTGRARSGRPADTLLNLLGRALLFPHHVNHHLEHHLYPAVPHYHLPRLHRLLAAKGALRGAEMRDLADTLRRVFAPRPVCRPPPVHPQRA